VRAAEPSLIDGSSSVPGRRIRLLVASLAVSFPLAGCGVFYPAPDGSDGGADRPAADRSGGQTGQVSLPGGTLAKDTRSGFYRRRSRLEMRYVERHPDRSVLRFAVTSREREREAFDFGRQQMTPPAFDFTLVDPVAGKAYTRLLDGSGQVIGSIPWLETPGVRYEAEVHFPPVPAEVTTVTVITPTSAGEFTGVPVVDGALAAASPRPGDAGGQGGGTLETHLATPASEQTVFSLNGVGAAPDVAGAAAPFRPADGQTVASRTGVFEVYGDRQRRRIDVKPFYRDGAYLVVVLEVTILEPLDTRDEYWTDGSEYREFVVVDPAGGTKYRRVLIGTVKDPKLGPGVRHVDQDWFSVAPEVGEPARVAFYVPAPPVEVRTVTLDAGPAGEIPGIPIE